MEGSEELQPSRILRKLASPSAGFFHARLNQNHTQGRERGPATLIRISADGGGRAQPRARAREDEWASERELHRATEVKRQFLQRHLELLVQRVEAQEEYLQSVTAASRRGMRNETRQEITIERLCHVLETRRRRAVVWRA
ncbi:MAG: hypothetical protein ACPIOQ_23650, partial [Promethearchaeia archaeon]